MGRHVFQKFFDTLRDLTSVSVQSRGARHPARASAQAQIRRREEEERKRREAEVALPHVYINIFTHLYAPNSRKSCVASRAEVRFKNVAR